VQFGRFGLMPMPATSCTAVACGEASADYVIWGPRFADILIGLPDGSVTIDNARFDDLME
jgi:hypothetical protein